MRQDHSGMSFFQALALVTAAFLIAGCAGYGKIRESDVERGQANQFVEQNYGGIQAYYSGTREKPGAILMDLKDQPPRFSARKWYPLNSKEELLHMMDIMVQLYFRRMRGNAGTYGPLLRRVLDQNGKLIGYFYSPVDQWPVRLSGATYSVDEVTYSQVREWSMGDIRSPSKKGEGSR